MKWRPNRLLWLGCVVAMAGGAAWAREVDRSETRRWRDSLISIEITRKQYDYLQPWSRRSQTVQKTGIVVAPGEVLTTASFLSDRTVVRMQRGGRGFWQEAAVKWVDYPADLALLTVTNAGFWQGLKVANLATRIPRDGSLQILRWRAGTLEVRQAEFNRFRVNNPEANDPAHVLLQLTSEVEGVGWGEPVVSGNRVVGLVFSQTGNFCQAQPAPLVRSVLEAQRQGTYRGMGYFDFVWQPAENPETLRYLKLPDAGAGVIVIQVPSRSDTAAVLRPRDVLLEIEGFAVDHTGDYVDPFYGHLLIENLSTRGRWAGDAVALKIWREGQSLDVRYALPAIETAARLVPDSPPDREPEYSIVGGLVFQPLTRNYLQSWGQDWERLAPFRLAYFRNEEPSPQRPAVLVLSSVLPDVSNLGYQDVRNLVLERVNGQPVSRLPDLSRALQNPQDGFHVFEFMKGETLRRIVLDAAVTGEATQRVLERYGIDRDQVVLD